MSKYTDELEKQYPELKNIWKVTNPELAKARAKKLGNKCKYCGRRTGSPDPNVLCKQCREDFGHSFFSEL